jgi:mono/diheme cytochrome c family protein
MVETFFYVIGAVVVVLALLISFGGMRSESFPSAGLMRGILAGMAALVVLTSTGAVLVAREEQQHRREEMDHLASEEAEAEKQANQEAEAPETAGEAAPGGAADGAAGIDGETVFLDTGCGGCHTLADLGQDAAGQIGPNLDTSLADRDADFIRTAIVDPNAEVTEGFASGIMPEDYEQQLTPEELDALVEYLDRTAGSN